MFSALESGSCAWQCLIGPLHIYVLSGHETLAYKFSSYHLYCLSLFCRETSKLLSTNGHHHLLLDLEFHGRSIWRYTNGSDFSSRPFYMLWFCEDSPNSCALSLWMEGSLCVMTWHWSIWRNVGGDSRGSPSCQELTPPAPSQILDKRRRHTVQYTYENKIGEFFPIKRKSTWKGMSTLSLNSLYCANLKLLFNGCFGWGIWRKCNKIQ